MDAVELQAASVQTRISTALGRVVAEHVGRGPTSIRTSIRDDVVVCVMRDTFTKAERKLVEAGEAAFDKEMRLQFQAIMRDDFVAAITELTGRTVEAFLSDHSMDPDVAVETFILAKREEPRGSLDGT